MHLQIVAALVQRQRMRMVLACARLCSGRSGWMAAGLLLELSHKQKFLVRTVLSPKLRAILTGEVAPTCISKVLACTRPCGGRRGWMAAGLLQALSLKQKFQLRRLTIPLRASMIHLSTTTTTISSSRSSSNVHF